MNRGVLRWYFRSERLTNRALAALRGCFDGLWLGVLSRAQLARIDEVYYDNSREYVSESYNRGGLSSWEQAAVTNHFPKHGTVVVTSAGGGREVLALAAAGYRVIGFEPHPGLVKFGVGLLRADGLADAELRPCEHDVWPAGVDRADAVVVGWGGYMLIPGHVRRVSFLRQAALLLPAGAPVLLSFFTRQGDGVRLRMTVRLGNPLRRLLRREPVALGDALVPNLVHLFTRSEVASELAEAGFELVDFGSEEYGWAVGRRVADQREHIDQEREDRDRGSEPSAEATQGSCGVAAD